MPTRTGQFSIGFRRNNSPWQADLPALLQWAEQSGFQAIDLTQSTPAEVRAVIASGLRLGTVDLLEMGKLLVADPAQRRQRIDRNIAYLREMSEAGATTFFTVLLPDDFAMKRSDAYALAVETIGPLADAAAALNVRIAIEGWPGPAPTYPALFCTPETVRALIRDTNPKSIGINYDPSHLIRLGVDPARFLREFLPGVFHVHAKDTAHFPDAIYELGLYQDSAFTSPHKFGQHAWRYTLPGQGVAPWPELFSILNESSYAGPVSIELEDENFHGSPESEKLGLALAREFLAMRA